MKTVLSLCVSIISVALLSGTLTACASGLDDRSSAANDTLSDAPANNLKQISPCGAMPPIKDRSKLKQSLLERGLIKEEMSLDEADRIVAEYINKRQQAFEDCPKKRK
ncbi:hypothetical protein Ssed_4433 [Shewanella sediminis HAW-EB3]|uniref:Lipoprotein n=1 Tax=Shewanella sediminis (strain HAW-EB3) TaxID=425104 RepID=A8G1R2_SHESH|nr:hypothetical protein [Shewanella sediminis]ABV39035.1 hypothetical protein Ssed_4433 [Shewanella sediminis HAW-EB3]